MVAHAPAASPVTPATGYPRHGLPHRRAARFSFDVTPAMRFYACMCIFMQAVS
jgi:hypothetical protein